VAVSSAGPYASLHLALDRKPCQHPIAQFLQAGCPSCRPTNSVKALKGAQSDPNYVSRLGLGPVANVCRGPKYYSYATAHDLFLLACTLIRMRYCPLLLLLLLFLAHQHKAAGRKTRLQIQNYGCNGNLLCYHGVVERNRISCLQSHGKALFYTPGSIDRGVEN